MNPFTNAPLKQIRNPEIADYVAFWDQVEVLVIRIYKGKRASPEDEREWADIRTWLLTHHSKWAKTLAAYWSQTRIGFETTVADPFDALLAYQKAADFLDNWRAMQTLPAARETINRWLVDLIERQQNTD